MAISSGVLPLPFLAQSPREQDAERAVEQGEHQLAVGIGRAAVDGVAAGVPRELAYLLIAFPISVAGFVVTVTLISAGAGTIVTFFIGLVLIIAALYVSRGFGTLELIRLEWAGRPAILGCSPAPRG